MSKADLPRLFSRALNSLNFCGAIWRNFLLKMWNLLLASLKYSLRRKSLLRTLVALMMPSWRRVVRWMLASELIVQYLFFPFSAMAVEDL